MKRPISPHLGIYKPQITWILSITHRITGGILSGAFILPIVWLGCLAAGEDVFTAMIHSTTHPLIRCIGGGILFSFYLHLCLGVRHLAWDIGLGFNIKTVTMTGWLSVFIALILTILTWQMGLTS